MPAFGSGRILSALVLITACSALPADARWRHYGYHWYGRAWYNYQNHGDEVRGDHAPAAEDKNSARYQGRGFGATIERMIRACDQQADDLKSVPVDAINQSVKPTSNQRRNLEQLASASAEAARTLAANCPKELSADLDERLNAFSHTLSTMAASLVALRPMFASYYGSLDEEQKARLLQMTTRASDNAEPHSELDPRSSRNQDVSGARVSDYTFCQQWVAALRNWPIKQIEDKASLSDEQHASLYELTATLYRAAGKLSSVCDGDNHITPPGRVDARIDQLNALQQSVETIRPLLSQFESELTDEQAARLSGLVTLSPRAKSVSR